MNPLLFEGLTDALGFLAGVLVAYLLGRLLGFDPLAAGHGSDAIGGIVLAGLGGGLGLHAARRWRAARRKER
jgi:membrane protein DedA with SNARE-associated domain